MAAGCGFLCGEKPSSCAISGGNLPLNRMAKKLRKASTILLKLSSTLRIHAHRELPDPFREWLFGCKIKMVWRCGF